MNSFFRFDSMPAGTFTKDVVIGILVNNVLKASVTLLAGFGIYKFLDRTLVLIERIILRPRELPGLIQNEPVAQPSFGGYQR